MAIEASGALGAKLGAMFAASAVGAAIIAAYHPPTRRDTWWQALGAGVGGVTFGPVMLKLIIQRFPDLAPHGDFYSWLSLAAPALFMFGGVFWGLVGALRHANGWIGNRGFSALRKKVGL